MRWSKLLIPTMKEVPQDAEIPSHQLMLRAGLIRKLASGLYTFLPLGLRALQKVSAIVRDEMDRAGAQEVLMPAMQPKKLWDQTGRYETLKDVMFGFEDRQKRFMVLGPTHEEVIALLVAREITSYRQLPANFYQIQTKFRDEIRPRFGLMRAREFIMKDAYSFDATLEDAEKSYQSMYQAYARIFKRCGLDTKVVEADTGAMGGSNSHEFMAPAEAGEDVILESDVGSYAANLEKATSIATEPKEFDGAEKAMGIIETPGMRTVAEVVEFLNAQPCQMIKTLIYKVAEKVIAALVPGSREVNELKLAKALGGVPELADDETIARVTGAPVGFAGPVGLDLRIIADKSLEGLRGGITGANQVDAHFIHVDLSRDAKISSYEDIAFAKEGDQAPGGKGRLKAKRGIEVGHVFMLGTKYTEALGATFLGKDGKEHVPIMGCYGIGVSRTLQSVIEQSHDKAGIIWPISIAPFPVEILPLNTKSGMVMKVAEQLEQELEAQGVEVLMDDRSERPGFKFKDADLLGIPIRLVIGDRSLDKGEVEITLRRDNVKECIAVEKVGVRALELLRGLSNGEHRQAWTYTDG